MAVVNNNSANAVNKNVIIPEVYADLVNEKIAGHVAVAQLADTDGTLMGQPGETIHFPAWAYIGDAVDRTVGNAIPTKSLQQTERDATVKLVAPDGIDVYDYDSEVAYGNAVEKAAELQGIAIARKVDTDLITDAFATPLQSAIASPTAVTYAEMNAMLQMYGDDANKDDFAGIVMNSVFVPSLLGMDGFVDGTLTHTQDGNGIQLNNVLGYFRGIPVIVSDRLYDTQTTEAFILAIKKNSLKFVPKEMPFVELARDASKRCTSVFTSQIYATCLVDDSGIVLAKKTLPNI